MSAGINVREFKYSPGENDSEYIEKLLNLRDIDKEIISKARARIKELTKENAQLKARLKNASEWIPCKTALPEMHDAGILKKLGVQKRSKKCIIALSEGGECVTEQDAELRDGKWHSNLIQFLEAGKRKGTVVAWMMPKPYEGGKK